MLGLEQGRAGMPTLTANNRGHLEFLISAPWGPDEWEERERGGRGGKKSEEKERREMLEDQNSSFC